MKKQKDGWFYFSISIMLIVGLVCIIVTSIMPEGRNTFLRLIVGNIGAIMLTGGTCEIISKHFLKQSYINYISEKIKLKEEVNKAGIEEVYLKIKDLDFSRYIKNSSQNIDIVHIYGFNWIRDNYDDLIDLLLKKNSVQVRVILLSPDSLFIPGIADHINKDPAYVKERILEATNKWKEANKTLKLKKGKKFANESVQLYYHNGQPTHSIYRFDDRLIITERTITKGDKSKLTSIVYLNNGFNECFYTVYLNQITDLIKSSDPINLDERNDGAIATSNNIHVQSNRLGVNT